MHGNLDKVATHNMAESWGSSARLTDALADANEHDSASRAIDPQPLKTRVCRYFSSTGIISIFYFLFQYFHWFKASVFICICGECRAACSVDLVIFVGNHERGGIYSIDIDFVEMTLDVAFVIRRLCFRLHTSSCTT